MMNQDKFESFLNTLFIKAESFYTSLSIHIAKEKYYGRTNTAYFNNLISMEEYATKYRIILFRLQSLTKYFDCFSNLLYYCPNLKHYSDVEPTKPNTNFSEEIELEIKTVISEIERIFSFSLLFEAGKK